MIDRMTHQDLADVVELSKQLGYDVTASDLEKRFKKIENSPAHALFVARDQQNRAIGYAHVVRETNSLLADERAELHALVVHERHRGQKIGERLLAQAEHWAREHGFTQMRLRSNIKRERAHLFYERNGYENQKTSYVFVKNLS